MNIQIATSRFERQDPPIEPWKDGNCFLHKIRDYETYDLCLNEGFIIVQNKKIIYIEDNIRYSIPQASKNCLSERFRIATLLEFTGLNEHPCYLNFKTGVKKHFAQPGSYHNLGHFYSFNAVFCQETLGKDYYCLDLETDREFYLFDDIRRDIPDALDWSICPKDGCILVFTRQEEILVYDLPHHTVVEKVSLKVGNGPLQIAWSRFYKEQQTVVVSTVTEHGEKQFQLTF